MSTVDSDAPVGLLFPGQGTQAEGMGLPWRDVPSWALVEQISGYTGVDLEELLIKADNDTLRRTDLAQLAVFTTSVVAYAEAVRTGVVTEVAGYAGHSLGEYVALYASGALRLEDAARLVAVRGQAMLRAAALRAGTMVVLLRAGIDAAEAIVSEATEQGHEVWIANLNGPTQLVLSGAEDGIEAVVALAPEHEAKAVRVAVGGAFHSPLMAPAAEELGQALRTTTFAEQHGTVVANVDAAAHGGGTDWPDLEIRQLTNPVRWEQSVHTLVSEVGCGRFLELGPGKTLAGMVKRIVPGVPTVSVNNPEVMGALRG